MMYIQNGHTMAFMLLSRKLTSKPNDLKYIINTELEEKDLIQMINTM